MEENHILEVKDLHTSFFTPYGEVKSVRGVSFSLHKGEVMGIVGESGCGKSVTVRSVMGILSHPGKVVGGEVWFDGKNILECKEKEWRDIRGNKMAMIFQDPMTALNPVLTIGYQLREMILAHQKGVSKEEAKKQVLHLMDMVKIPEPQVRYKQYPHEFSGGMRQRIMIAMALANDPDILIADEPTTALDVTIQDQILSIMKDLKEEKGKSIILITHDLGVVAQICTRVLVMYGGQVVEEGDVFQIFEHPSHPYTRGLLASLPSYQKERTGGLYSIPGAPPNLANEIKGCAFAPRCQEARKLCMLRNPELLSVDQGHFSRCHLCDPQVMDALKKWEGGTKHV